jgi:hypothetical protein
MTSSALTFPDALRTGAKIWANDFSSASRWRVKPSSINRFA